MLNPTTLIADELGEHLADTYLQYFRRAQA